MPPRGRKPRQERQRLHELTEQDLLDMLGQCFKTGERCTKKDILKLGKLWEFDFGDIAEFIYRHPMRDRLGFVDRMMRREDSASQWKQGLMRLIQNVIKDALVEEAEEAEAQRQTRSRSQKPKPEVLDKDTTPDPKPEVLDKDTTPVLAEAEARVIVQFLEGFPGVGLHHVTSAIAEVRDQKPKPKPEVLTKPTPKPKPKPEPKVLDKDTVKRWNKIVVKQKYSGIRTEYDKMENELAKKKYIEMVVWMQKNGTLDDFMAR